MTRIDFHSNVSDRLTYACRLARKIYVSGARLVILGDDEVLLRLDNLLWSFSQIDFVPHCYADHTLAAHTPILLSHQLEGLSDYSVLLNMMDEPPPLFSRFERLLEIVDTKSPQRLAARSRYRFYRDRGYHLQNFDQKGLG